MTLATLRYYLRSLATLLRGVRNLSAVAWQLAARRGSDTATIRVVLTGGLRFDLRQPLDLWVLKEVALDREYQRLGPEIAAGWTVVDIGAAHGEFAIPAALRVGDGRVVAVEPSPLACALLRGNAALNGAARIEVVELAVGARAGIVPLALAVRGTMENTTAAAGAATTIPVAMASLEGLFERAAVDRCDYLKIDCEGGEFDILLPATDATLQRIARICLEYHDGITVHRHGALARRLAAAGFAVRTQAHPIVAGQGWLYAERLS